MRIPLDAIAAVTGTNVALPSQPGVDERRNMKLPRRMCPVRYAPDWRTIKNRTHPVMSRVMDAFACDPTADPVTAPAAY
jgi:hypothetical protein